MWWWTLLSWIVAAVTLFYVANREASAPAGDVPHGRRARSVGPVRGFFAALTKVGLSIGLIGLGYMVEPAVWAGMQGGVQGLAEFGAGLGETVLSALSGAALPASIALMAALDGRTRFYKARRAAIAAVLLLVVSDALFNYFYTRPLESFLFSLFSDVIGGALAGIVIAMISEMSWRRPATPAASTTEPTQARGRAS